MSMLAGPRRKQKVINLRAKNNAWSNDNNKFGQRMLEKMGWSTGKGLGAKENGIVEHVVARYRNDEKGLGYEDKNDQWTKHEDDFNALLANLSNAGSNEEKLHSGISLEVKSKKSKARVHYHKFMRGKDLSRYSEKDLANIFGKKSFNDEEKHELLKEDVKITEQVFTEKGSMEDYFKNKMAAIKSKSLKNNENCMKKENDEADYGFRGFSGTFKTEGESEKIQGSSCQLISFYSESTTVKVNKECDNSNTEDNLVYGSTNNGSIENNFSMNETKKNKNKYILNDSNEKLESNEKIDKLIKKEKKLKKKKKSDEIIMKNEFQNCGLKKKKSKHKDISDETKDQQFDIEENISGETQVPKKKKKKKQTP